MASERTIAELAYHLWLARGAPIGSAELDWQEAERQVLGRAPEPQKVEQAPELGRK